MEGTDVTQFADGTSNNDHTYYGDTCAVKWDVGTSVTCTLRTVQTYDNETQGIGVYYNFQATTSGSGGPSLSTQNANAPDTFCPLGWQVPYGGTGGDYYDKSRSWRYLFQSYSFVPETPPYGNDVREYPISLIASGNYRWGDGRLYSASFDGDYQASTVREQYYNYQFDVGGTTFHVERSTGKSFGQAIRCVTRY